MLRCVYFFSGLMLNLCVTMLGVLSLTYSYSGEAHSLHCPCLVDNCLFLVVVSVQEIEFLFAFGNFGSSLCV